MYYQFNTQSKGWKEDRKPELADKLAYELELQMSKAHLTGSFPFVQVDRYGDDVTISRITNLSVKQQEKLVKAADKIYDKVMA